MVITGKANSQKLESINTGLKVPASKSEIVGVSPKLVPPFIYNTVKCNSYLKIKWNTEYRKGAVPAEVVKEIEPLA